MNKISYRQKKISKKTADLVSIIMMLMIPPIKTFKIYLMYRFSPAI